MRFIFDLETANAKDEYAEIERRYAKTGNMKDPEKIAAKQAGLKLGVTDSAPIFSMAFRFGSVLGSFSWATLSSDDRAMLASAGITAITFEDERSLLQGVSGLLQGLPTTTRLVGHNSERFDIPKLRFRMSFHGLPKLDALFTWRRSDTMKVFRESSVIDKPFFALAECAEKFCIPYHKGVPGDQVNTFIESGRHVEVLMMNVADVLITEQVANKLHIPEGD